MYETLGSKRRLGYHSKNVVRQTEPWEKWMARSDLHCKAAILVLGEHTLEHIIGDNNEHTQARGKGT